jgi:Tol biopolymer transport system component
VSRDASGVGSGGADTAVVSPDGTKVAFRSHKADLGPTDTNGLEDIFVRDLVTGETTLVTANAAGTDSGNGRVTSAAVFDRSGTKVAFTSEATDLVPQATAHPQNVFVRDLATGTTTLVSIDEAGTGSGDGWSGHPVFSPDGTKVAFTSDAHNLVPVVNSYYAQAYLRDLVSGTTTLLSRDNEGNVGYHAADVPGFLPDGTGVFVVTASWLLGPLHPTAGRRSTSVTWQPAPTSSFRKPTTAARGTGTRATPSPRRTGRRWRSPAPCPSSAPRTRTASRTSTYATWPRAT